MGGILEMQEQFLGYVQDERYDAVPWTVFCSCKNCISTIHGGHGKARICPGMNGILKLQEQILGYVQDDRSGFLLQANPKYLHPYKQ